MTNFSVTERGTFKVCRRQHRFSSLNHDALTNIKPNKNLLLGSLVHATLADWCAGLTDYIPAQFETYYHTAMQFSEEAYRQGYGFSMSREEKLYYEDEVLHLGYAMTENYQQKYVTPLPPGYHLIAAEQTVVTPVPGTGHCTCQEACVCPACGMDRYVAHPALFKDMCQEGCPCWGVHNLESTFDGLVEYQGRVFILEHKTYNAKPNMNELEMNDQFLAYLWVAQNFGAVGVFYNGLWKRKEPPRGRTFDDLFLRTFLLRNQQEIEEFGRMLPYELNDMETGYPYPTRAWSSCPSCGFQDLCRAVSEGQDTEDILAHFTQREKTPAWR